MYFSHPKKHEFGTTNVLCGARIRHATETDDHASTGELIELTKRHARVTAFLRAQRDAFASVERTCEFSNAGSVRLRREQPELVGHALNVAMFRARTQAVRAYAESQGYKD